MIRAKDRAIALGRSGIRIDGEPRTLLCASLFYFRLPREQWQARLQQIKDSGYTCVDVYLPWNFHELAPGRWSFDGRRDVAGFLDLAHETGLYVVARPGPYICSEWDGGALPAWLGLDPLLAVRQYEPRFLAQVGAWFDQVLPLLAERQYPAGGPVVMVQLENELDFFDCADRTGYLTALREMAERHGITVPLIACAGQGDLAGATGDVPGIVPACNFYPDDDSPHIEEEVRHYAHLLAERGLPLLITETNRRHRTLRRLLASGAELIAPYLQSSGWNFGFTPSCGNWGGPGNFMSHDYDFGGFVSSTGAERPEYAEAQVLARVIDVLGPRLAGAPTAASPVEVTCDFPTSMTPSARRLDGGGHLVAVPHLGTRPGRAVVRGVPVAVPPDSCPLVLVDMPLRSWGHEATLNLASADLVGVAGGTLVFSSAVPVTVIVDGTPAEIPSPTPGRAERVVAAGLTLVALAPTDAARLRSVDADGTVRIADTAGRLVAAMPAAAAPVTARPGVDQSYALPAANQSHALPGVEPGLRRRTAVVPERPAGSHALPPALESLGVYRGRGTYRTTADLTDVDELLLTGAADIADLSIGGRVHPSIAAFGAARRIDVREVTGSVAIEALVEIWGHSNFDDARLPALRAGALRGLGALWKVRAVTDVSEPWRVLGHWAGDPAPLRSLGGWSSTRIGEPVTYSREIPSSVMSALNMSALHILGLDRPVQIAVNDGLPNYGPPITIHAENPWVLLPADSRMVRVTMPHHPSGGRLYAELLDLEPVTGWSCTTQDDESLAGFAGAVGTTYPVELPIAVEPGEEAWLDVDLPPSDGGTLLRVEGTQIRVTGWAAGECVGRVWVGDRPDFAGGDPNLLWIPAGWSDLTVLVRGLAGEEKPRLSRLCLEFLPA